mmetsp:Transcript_20173/g.14885  ORF Transcript_20173/g.14885 Transcript_20173/m.14885 type:complete len:95 (+) Transcript_20173:72-356(+)
MDNSQTDVMFLSTEQRLESPSPMRDLSPYQEEVKEEVKEVAPKKEEPILEATQENEPCLTPKIGCVEVESKKKGREVKSGQQARGRVKYRGTIT